MDSGPKLVADFRRKYDRVISGQSSDIRIVDVIAYLNEAQYLWFESRAIFVEANTKARNELRNFEVKRKKLSVKELDKYVSYFEYPEDFYRDLSVSVSACCKGCPLPKEFVVTKAQSDDLAVARKDPFLSASFEYEQILGDEAGDRYYLYHEGRMEVKESYLDYLRKPKEIHAASLVDCGDGRRGYEYNGVFVSKDSPFEGDSTYSARVITDIAVLAALRDRGRTQDYQTQLDKYLRLEKS